MIHKSFLERIRHEKESPGAYLVLSVGFGTTPHGCCPPPMHPVAPLAFTIPTNEELTLNDWLPKCYPAFDDNFFGVNRGVDLVRLCGVRTNNCGGSVKEGIIFSAMENFRNGGAADACAMNTYHYFQLAAELGYPVVEAAEIDVEVPSPLGKITCFPDRSVEPGSGFMVQLDTWCLYGDKLLVCEAPGLNLRMEF